MRADAACRWTAWIRCLHRLVFLLERSKFAHLKPADVVKHFTSDVACGATVCLYLHQEWRWCGLSEGSPGCGHARRNVLIAWGVPLVCVDGVDLGECEQGQYLCRRGRAARFDVEESVVSLACGGVVVG